MSIPNEASTTNLEKSIEINTNAANSGSNIQPSTMPSRNSSSNIQSRNKVSAIDTSLEAPNINIKLSQSAPTSPTTPTSPAPQYAPVDISELLAPPLATIHPTNRLVQISRDPNAHSYPHSLQYNPTHYNQSHYNPSQYTPSQYGTQPTPYLVNIDLNYQPSNGQSYRPSWQDLEKPKPLTDQIFAAGYPSTAAIMATDSELSVYRRFDRLSVRNLLYYQSELMHLESKLDKFDEEDRLDNEREEGRYAQRSWTGLWDGLDPETNERKNLVLEIRSVLREYNEALHYHKEMLNTEAPSKRVIKSMRNWKRNQDDPPIVDISETAYDHPFENDLVALKSGKTKDALSMFVQDKFGRFFKRKLPNRIPNSKNVLYFSETAIETFSMILSTIMAVVVLVGAMTSLYFVKSQGIRLALVWVFTALFAIATTLMANLKKGEIFLATAAYCAVLVVYISGTS